MRFPKKSNKPRDVLSSGSAGEGAANGDSDNDNDDNDSNGNGNGDGDGDGDVNGNGNDDGRAPRGQWGAAAAAGAADRASSVRGTAGFPRARVRIPDYLR